MVERLVTRPAKLICNVVLGTISSLGLGFYLMFLFWALCNKICLLVASIPYKMADDLIVMKGDTVLGSDLPFTQLPLYNWTLRNNFTFIFWKNFPCKPFTNTLCNRLIYTFLDSWLHSLKCVSIILKFLISLSQIHSGRSPDPKSI